MTFFSRAWRDFFALLVAIAFLTSCGKSNNSPDLDVGDKFVGVWSSEACCDGSRNMLVTSFASDGTFYEIEKFSDGDFDGQEVRYSGNWSFDGVNLKRKYTSKNGKPLANAQFGYITLAVKEYGISGFIGVNNIDRISVKFNRINAQGNL